MLRGRGHGGVCLKRSQGALQALPQKKYEALEAGRNRVEVEVFASRELGVRCRRVVLRGNIEIWSSGGVLS